MPGNWPVRFLGGGAPATALCYPTPFRFAANPGLLGAVAELVKSALVGILEAMTDEAQRPLHVMALQSLYNVFPAAIQKELARDTDFMARLGLRQVVGIPIQGIVFEAEAFLRAASEAVNGREAPVHAAEASIGIVLQPFQDDQGRRLCRFAHPTTGQVVTVDNAEMDVLVHSG
jgi:hypothetical protein